ncbi:MAG: hypothetical protein KGN02_04125 [bacterium]|nr:hypothetical protein [bacterium]
MKHLTVALLFLALGLATAGPSLADQTFWTITAGPSMPPAPSPWPVTLNVDYLTYACDYRGRHTSCFCRRPNGYDTRRRCFVGRPPRPPYPPIPPRSGIRPLPIVRLTPPVPPHP